MVWKFMRQHYAYDIPRTECRIHTIYGKHEHISISTRLSYLLEINYDSIINDIFEHEKVHVKEIQVQFHCSVYSSQTICKVSVP